MIWCVDDDNTIRDIEVYTLRQTGFEAQGFANGRDMLEALKTQRPELIVLDIMMPGDDGIEILKMLRRSPEWRDIPVIMAPAKGTEPLIFYMFSILIRLVVPDFPLVSPPVITILSPVLRKNCEAAIFLAV